jgi:hypothetical protein
LRGWKLRLQKEKCKWEVEAERWAAEDAFRKVQLKLKSQQLAVMEARNKVDKEAQKGPVKLLKKYGDVLHNSPLGNDILEFIPFCDNNE